MYLSSTAEREGSFKKRWHTQWARHPYIHCSDTFQTDSLTVCLAPLSLLFVLIVHTKNEDINIWAFEPWKLIIYERINKVPVVLKTAWKSIKTELMLLEFRLTSWHYLDYESFSRNSLKRWKQELRLFSRTRKSNEWRQNRGAEDFIIYRIYFVADKGSCVLTFLLMETATKLSEISG